MSEMDKKNTQQEDGNVVLETNIKKPNENQGAEIESSEIIQNKTPAQKEKSLDKVEKETSEQTKEQEFEEEIIKLRDEKLRLLAEMENLRKRTDKERLDSIRYGSMNLARDILSPDDNLTRALEAIPNELKDSDAINNLIDGLKMVQKEFSSIIERHGVKKIKALNTKFDHNFHQAMIEIEDDDVAEGTVIQEMQSGYTMYDRLLRPSMVGVSKKADKNVNSEKNIDEKS